MALCHNVNLHLEKIWKLCLRNFPTVKFRNKLLSSFEHCCSLQDKAQATLLYWALSTAAVFIFFQLHLKPIFSFFSSRSHFHVFFDLPIPPCSLVSNTWIKSPYRLRSLAAECRAILRRHDQDQRSLAAPSAGRCDRALRNDQSHKCWRPKSLMQCLHTEPESPTSKLRSKNLSQLHTSMVFCI